MDEWLRFVTRLLDRIPPMVGWRPLHLMAIKRWMQLLCNCHIAHWLRETIGIGVHDWIHPVVSPARKR